LNNYRYIEIIIVGYNSDNCSSSVMSGSNFKWTC